MACGNSDRTTTGPRGLNNPYAADDRQRRRLGAGKEGTQVRHHDFGHL